MIEGLMGVNRHEPGDYGRGLLVQEPGGSRAHNSGFGMRFEMACERPPRLRGIRWLRDFLLTAQPPLLMRRGISHRNSDHQYLGDELVNSHCHSWESES